MSDDDQRIAAEERADDRRAASGIDTQERPRPRGRAVPALVISEHHRTVGRNGLAKARAALADRLVLVDPNEEESQGENDGRVQGEEGQ